VRKAVSVEVRKAGVARPTQRLQSSFVSNVFEPIAPKIAIHRGKFEAVGKHVPRKCVSQTEILPLCSFVVAGILADVGNQKIQKTVVVVVEEHGTRGMCHQSHSRLLSDVAKLPASVVLEQVIAAANSGDEKILIAIVVDIREGGSHA